MAACVLVLSALGQSDRVVMNAQHGHSITWDGNNGGYSSPEPGAGPSDNAALYTHGTIAFGSSEVGLNLHFILNVNDGYYGNSSSWIPDFIAAPDPDPFIGLNFGQTVAVSSIGWGRDNADATEPACGGTCMDRCVGVYTLQFTRAANPDAWTAETGDAATGWATIGTVEYLAGADTPFFSAYLRHRFDVAAEGSPIQASGLRIKVSNNTMAIDEIEVNPEPDPVPPISDFIVLEPVAPYTITWDLNNGNFATPDSPAPAPKNRALSTKGTTAFGSTEFGAGVHFFSSVNDGLYGNSHSWIPNFSLPDPDPFIGLKFGALIELQNICWSRDNGDATEADCGGTCTDRALGVYTLQMTRVANPGPDTPETGDTATGWITIGTVNYRAEGTMFTPYLRHRFDVGTTNNAPVQASGLRIKVPNASTAIDELEINVNVGQELSLVDIQPAPDYTIVWDGNDGEFYNPDAGARSPENDALAVKGSTAFGSSELGFGVHFVSKVNDGLYGNSSSWISANGLGEVNDPDPFIGVKFGKLIDIQSIAWARDNGDATEGGCGGTCLDRCWGVNTVQITRVADPGIETIETDDPATGWITIGTVEYKAALPPTFNPSRRHRFDVAHNGQPVQATGFRIKVGDGMTALDELEINPSEQGVAPPITDLIVITSVAGYEVAWDGNDGEFNNTAAGAAPPDNLALAAHGTTAFGSSEHAAGGHLIANANDGLYGNSHGWLATMTDPAPFIGLDFGKLIGVRTIAWGRDNGDTTEPGCAGGTCTEGAVGTYTLQVTRVADPQVATPETGDPATGWVTIGTLEYKTAFPTLFNPHLRHRYDVSSDGQPIAATGIRIKPSSNTMVIDEIEVNPALAPDQNLLVITPEMGYAITWDGNNGDYSSADPGATAPDNAALSRNGATVFASSAMETSMYSIGGATDGLYGDTHAWAANVVDGADLDPFVGVAFGQPIAVTDVAFGRDNVDDTEMSPAGAHTNRFAGTYVLQFTTLEGAGLDTVETGDPASGWATVGSLVYRGGSSAGFRPYLRHSYRVSFEGQPISATALRLRVPANSNPTNQVAIDEFEVNTIAPVASARPVLSVERQGSELRISWTGQGTLQSADALTGGWTDVPGGTTSPQLVPMTAQRKFYRVRH